MSILAARQDHEGWMNAFQKNNFLMKLYKFAIFSIALHKYKNHLVQSKIQH